MDVLGMNIVVNLHQGNTEIFVIEISSWNGCPSNEKYCEYASNGDLECLKYLHDNGCPWNERCCVYATLNGHLEVMKYLHENGYRLNEKCCEYVSSWEEWMNYLHEKCFEMKWIIC